MTAKRFWQEPYRTELATRVASVAGEEVTLEETIFYALSGGQESDRGSIAKMTQAWLSWAKEAGNEW